MIMAINGDYLNAYLEECQAYGFNGGPTYSTQLVSLRNGHERRNAMWDQPKHVFTTGYNNISTDGFRSIKRMFMQCRGMAKAFKFRDWLDYQANNEDFAIGDGTKKVFQLAKVSITDGIQYFRYVYVIRPGAQVFINDVASPISYTIDNDRGTVTFATAPANGAVLSWTGEFDIWVRFNTDSLSFSLDNPDATNGQIQLTEVSPPPPAS